MGTGQFLRILIPFAAGYFLSYLYRTVNAVIAGTLTDDPSLGGGGLDASSLGLLTAAYFLTFAVAQVPLGILLDRYGPRKIEAVLLLFAALGAVVFALADGLVALIAGRALIGLGVSACLMAAFKAFRQWFDAEKLPLMQGLIMAAGGLGAMSATVPVEAALTVTDWRGVFLALAAVTVVVAAGLFLTVPDKAHEGAPENLRQQFIGVALVFRSRLFWTIAPAAMVSQALYMSMQGLWAGPWLRDVAGVAEPGGILFFLAGAMIVGHLITGALTERLGRVGITPSMVFATGNLLLLTTLVLLAAGVTVAPLPLWVAFGLCGTTSVLSYAILAQAFPPHMAGRANTAVNLLIFVAAFGLQWGIGLIIGLWERDAAGRYPVEAYGTAFGLSAALLAVMVAWLVWSLVATRRQNQKPAQG